MSTTKVLRLYRSLLREVSYFFDSQARSYLKSYIRHNFEVNREIACENRNSRLRTLVKYARRCNSTLIKANAGNARATMKVLRMTYGRTGPRSLELLKPLLTDSQRQPLVPGDDETRPPIVTSKLQALLAQTKGGKGIVPEFSIHDFSSSSLRKRKETNLLWNLYYDAIKKVLPPIPEDEFEKLEKLATGELVEEIPPRRTRPDTRKAKKDSGERIRLKVFSKIDQRNIDLSFKQHIYKTILAECPKLVQSKSRPGKWNAIFSDHKGAPMLQERVFKEYPS